MGIERFFRKCLIFQSAEDTHPTCEIEWHHVTIACDRLYKNHVTTVCGLQSTWMVGYKRVSCFTCQIPVYICSFRRWRRVHHTFNYNEKKKLRQMLTCLNEEYEMRNAWKCVKYHTTQRVKSWTRGPCYITWRYFSMPSKELHVMGDKTRVRKTNIRHTWWDEWCHAIVISLTTCDISKVWCSDIVLGYYLFLSLCISLPGISTDSPCLAAISLKACKCAWSSSIYETTINKSTVMTNIWIREKLLTKQQ